MKIILGLVLTISLFANCSKDKAEQIIVVDCGTTTKSFATDVKPIFDNNCVVCHNSANNFANGQSWETYEEISVNINSIVKAIKHQPGKTPMPFELPQLSDSLINVIECWKIDGAQNN